MELLYKVYKMRAKTDLTLTDEEGNEKVIKEGTLFEVYEKMNFQFTLIFTIIEGKDYDIYIDEEVMEVINIYEVSAEEAINLYPDFKFIEDSLEGEELPF